jgi:hypothetical protein
VSTGNHFPEQESYPFQRTPMRGGFETSFHRMEEAQESKEMEILIPLNCRAQFATLVHVAHRPFDHEKKLQ